MSSKQKQPYSSSIKKKRKTLTLATKLNIVRKFQNGMKIFEIARKLDLPQTTVRTITADKERILEAVENAQSLNSSIIRKRHGLVDEMERMLRIWCEHHASIKNCPIDQNTVCNEANRIFRELKEKAGDTAKDESFAASNGWLSRFKNRCNREAIAMTTDINDLLDQELTVDELMEIREQNFVEESEEKVSVPAEKQMTIAKLTEGLDFIEHGMRILEDIDSNEERVLTMIREIKRLVSPYEDILYEKRTSLSRQI